MKADGLIGRNRPELPRSLLMTPTMSWPRLPAPARGGSAIGIGSLRALSTVMTALGVPFGAPPDAGGGSDCARTPRGAASIAAEPAAPASSERRLSGNIGSCVMAKRSLI